MDFNWAEYKGNLTWLKDRTIFLTLYGSKAYGTSTPQSDTDIRGIAIAPKQYYYGYLNKFEQAESKEPDLVIFELKKFFKLAADCNPNALEILFTEESDHIYNSKLGRKLIDNRELFLSRKIKHTFQGYAHSQYKRIILHRRYLLSPVLNQPTRAEYGLPERTVIPADQLAAATSAINKQLDEWNWRDMEDLDPSMRQALQDEFNRRLSEITCWRWEDVAEKTWMSAVNKLGFSTNFIELLDKERRYTARLKEFQQYQEWKKTRNPVRAAMEEKYGFDGKHALHLVRLSKCCKELLITGKLNVKRPDAEELLSIRNGAWSFEKLQEWFETQDKEIAELEKTSILPYKPNHNKLDQLCQDLIEESFS